MKVEFCGNMETAATRNTLNEALAEAGLTLQEYETLLKIGIIQQLQAAFAEDGGKMAISNLKVSFEEDAGAGGK